MAEEPIQVVKLGAPPSYDDSSNEDLLIKLRLLDYETAFCKKFNEKQTYRPMSKSYFNTQAENANEQFFYFTNLASFLISVCNGGNTSAYPPPDQFADPQLAVADLVQAIKSIDIPDKAIAPNKIRPGYGETCLALLTMLADRALLNRRFAFKAVQYPAAKSEAAAAGGDDKDASPARFGAFGGGAGATATDAVDDRVGDIGVSDDDEAGGGPAEEMFYGAGGVGLTGGAGRVGGGGAAAAEPIRPQVEAKEWQEEVERVAPRLQTGVTLEVRDWRARVEGALALMKAVDTMYPDVRAMLERVGDEMDKGLERIRKREQSLGQQFVEQVEEYRGKLRRLNALQENLNGVQGRVSAFSSELHTITAALEDVKAKIKEYEHRAEDQTPLVNIKAAVAGVRAEIKEMSLRIGVLQHTVLHYALRQQKERKGKQQQSIAGAGKLGRDSATGHGGVPAHAPSSSGLYGSPTGAHDDYSGYVGGGGAGGAMPELDFSGYMGM